MKDIIFIVLFVFGSSLSFAQNGFEAKMKTQKTAPKLNKTFRAIDGRDNQIKSARYLRTFSITTLHESAKFKTYRDVESCSIIFIENLQKADGSKLRKPVKVQNIDFLNEVKN